MLRDEALAKIAASLNAAGMPAEDLADVMAAVPDDVIQAVMEGHEIKPVIAKAAHELIETLVEAAIRHHGHIPGCDGHHDDDDLEPRNGILLTSDPDAAEPLSHHALANAANLIKTLITFVAMEQSSSFKRWMRDREDKGRVSNLDGIGPRFSDQVTPSMMAWLALSITNSHENCPDDSHGPGGGGVPEAFRKRPEPEPIIDPRMFHRF
jgi:hypothetical protein